MIQFIIGEKGRGKTKVLLEKANNEIKNVSG
ncbi:MAG TPA: twitching motility protein PilT, partial [Lachnospiraceae bacterium]|nr:twitching motility protein PilT [Lachnospiraceae bacterium]